MEYILWHVQVIDPICSTNPICKYSHTSFYFQKNVCSLDLPLLAGTLVLGQHLHHSASYPQSLELSKNSDIYLVLKEVFLFPNIEQRVNCNPGFPLLKAGFAQTNRSWSIRPSLLAPALITGALTGALMLECHFIIISQSLIPHAQHNLVRLTPDAS